MHRFLPRWERYWLCSPCYAMLEQAYMRHDVVVQRIRRVEASAAHYISDRL